MPKTPKEVLTVFGSDQLQWMAEARNIDSTEKGRKQLITELTDHVNSLGLSIMLRILKVKELKEMALLCDWEDEKIPTGKATIAKKIQETMEDMGPKKFLEKCDSTILRAIMKAMGVEPPASRKDYVDFITQTADEMGLENCLSSFPTTKLKEFVKICGLKTDSESLDTLLRALVEQESIKAYYEPQGDELPSKIKPDLKVDKNISVVDLYTHFFREDLSEFCEKNGLISHGSKKELVERIRRFWDGKLEPKDKKKIPDPTKKKKTSTQKKSDEEDSKKHTEEEDDEIESPPKGKKKKLSEENSVLKKEDKK